MSEKTKRTVKRIEVPKLLANPGNPREELDVESMMDEIILQGRVIEPLHVQSETMYVLRGNRRLKAVQALLAKPDLRADVKANIEKLDCIVYENLTPREILEIVFDHGQTKPLSRVEIVKSIWSLQRQMYDPVDIMILCYHNLARYTNSGSKAHEAAALKGDARKEYLKKWLKGTLNQFLMLIYELGDFVQRQLWLQDTKGDRKLNEAEEKEFVMTVSRERVAALMTAKKADEAKDGKGWTRADGGEHFNAKIREFVDKDSGINPDGTNPRKYTQKELKSVADGSHSTAMNMAYKHAAGLLSDPEKGKLDSVDNEALRLERLAKTCLALVDRIDIKAKVTGNEVAGILQQIIKGTEVTLTETLTSLLIPKETEEEEKPTAKVKAKELVEA